MAITVEFCGEIHRPEETAVFSIGREGDLQIDDNPYLHRIFLQLEAQAGLWFLVNVGTSLSATVTDGHGSVQAWLAPGARLPVVFERTVVLFTAGGTTYEFTVTSDAVPYQLSRPDPGVGGDPTLGPVTLTPAQKQIIVALAEPLLRREGEGISAIPTSKAAAARLGWEQTRFNRKLDNVCDKLDRQGVRGLRGGPGKLATNRRARLVEHAVSTRLVTADDLPLLELDLGGQEK